MLLLKFGLLYSHVTCLLRPDSHFVRLIPLQTVLRRHCHRLSNTWTTSVHPYEVICISASNNRTCVTMTEKLASEVWKLRISLQVSEKTSDILEAAFHAVTLPDYLDMPAELDETTALEEARRALAKCPLKEWKSIKDSALSRNSLFHLLCPDNLEAFVHLLQVPTLFTEAYNEFIRVKKGAYLSNHLR